MATTRRAGAAAVAGGAAWLALVPASALHRSGDLSFDGYYRVVAMPLLLLAAAWALLGLAWRPDDLRARLGYGLTLVGLTLAAAGTGLEFWGGWLAGEDSPRASGRPDASAWWGSDVGWALYVFGAMALFAGGPTAAVALRRRLPFWALALIALLGLGVLSPTLFDESSLAVTVPLLGVFGVGWAALGMRLGRRGSSDLT